MVYGDVPLADTMAIALGNAVNDAVGIESCFDMVRGNPPKIVISRMKADIITKT